MQCRTVTLAIVSIRSQYECTQQHSATNTTIALLISNFLVLDITKSLSLTQISTQCQVTFLLSSLMETFSDRKVTCTVGAQCGWRWELSKAYYREMKQWSFFLKKPHKWRCICHGTDKLHKPYCHMRIHERVAFERMT